MSVAHSLHIERPVEVVFDFWKDPHNQFSLAPDERVEVTDVEVTHEGVGTSYSIAAKLMGLTVESRVVFVEFIPNERIVDESSMAMHGRWTYTFAPEGSGTRMSMFGEPRSLWRWWPLDKLLDRVMGPRHDDVLRRLKAVLEETSTRH